MIAYNYSNISTEYIPNESLQNLNILHLPCIFVTVY